MDSSPARKRRLRYSGRNPRKFHEKYKELNPERYASDVQRVIQSGKTPAGMHRSIMVDEVLRVLSPVPGDVAVDCTLGFGGHARAILERVQPGGRLIGLDVDPFELPRTEARLKTAGFAAGSFAAHRSNFAGLPQVLAAEEIAGANPDRGFTYKESGPLDMRMNPSRGEPASRLLAHLSVEKLARLLEDHADEPHADLIAGLLKQPPMTTTEDLCRSISRGVTIALPRAGKREVEASIRRTFQALRIAVNDEFSALDALLRNLPLCLSPGGRVAILTFHSGEDRRVKKAFDAGRHDGTYAVIADDVIRPTRDEVRANPRASSAKLRWAVRDDQGGGQGWQAGQVRPAGLGGQG